VETPINLRDRLGVLAALLAFRAAQRSPDMGFLQLGIQLRI
jgi:hypothetical protein